MRKAYNRQNVVSYVAAAALFVAMLIVLLFATNQFATGSEQQGLDATHDAIERAAVLCYATEGYYPPSLSYIEEQYGVQIDYDSYVVRYDVFASNQMPNISVFKR